MFQVRAKTQYPWSTDSNLAVPETSKIRFPFSIIRDNVQLLSTGQVVTEEHAKDGVVIVAISRLAEVLRSLRVIGLR